MKNDPSKSRAQNKIPRYHLQQRSMGDPVELVTILKLPVDGLPSSVEEAVEAWESALVYQRTARARVTAAEKAVAAAPALDALALSALLEAAPDGGIDGSVELPTDAVDAAQAELTSSVGFLAAADALVSRTHKRLRPALREAAADWLPALHEQVGRGRSSLAASVYSAELELAKLGDTMALMELLERSVAVGEAEQARTEVDWRDDFLDMREVASVDAATEANRALRLFVGALAHVAGGDIT